MKRFYAVVVSVALAAALLSAGAAYCQEAQGEAQKPPAPAPAAKEAPVAEPEGLSIYGEIQAVNTSSNSIAVQYYDYDSDEERTIEITLDKDTKLEGAASLSGVKKGDWADVTYRITDDKKNVAGSVVIEKEEAPEGTSAEGVGQEELEE
jgi:hypothetical protein